MSFYEYHDSSQRKIIFYSSYVSMLSTYEQQLHILTLLGLQDLPPEQKETIIEGIIDLIEQRVANDVLAYIPPGERGAFIVASNTKDTHLVDQYMSQYVPDMIALVETHVAKLKEELVSRVDALV